MTVRFRFAPEEARANLRGLVSIGVSLTIVLSILFAALQFSACAPSPSARNLADGRLHVFFLPDCPHCHDAIEFLKTQSKIEFLLHDVSTRANQALLSTVARRHGISDLGVPLFVFGSHYLMGFDTAETTGRELLALVAQQTPTARPNATSNATESR